MARAPSHNEPLVVSTAELRDAILTWSVGRNFAETQAEVREGMLMARTVYLEAESGVPRKKVREIMRVASAITSVKVADDLITAMERPDLMPQVIPNPYWSQERWQAYLAERGCE